MANTLPQETLSRERSAGDNVKRQIGFWAVPQITFDCAGKDANDRIDLTTGIGEGGAAGQIPQD
jgi:hypothetical protein